MREGVRDRPLEDDGGRVTERSVRGKMLVEPSQRAEEARDVRFPFAAAGRLPLPLSRRERSGPLEQIPEVPDDLQGRTRLRTDALVGESARRIAQDLFRTVGEGSQRVAEENAFSSGVVGV